MAGIWLSESVGAIGGAARWLMLALPLVVVVVLVLTQGARIAGHIVTGLVLVLAVGVGFVRHQAVVNLPPHHIRHVLADEPILTRLVGEVVTTPRAQAAELRNPFLPFEPAGRTRLVLAVREFRTTSPPTPATGRVRVSIATEHAAGRKPMPTLGLRLGDRVELTGKLYAPRGPQNPGGFDWARWNYLQGIDAGMTVEGPQYVRRIGDDTSWLRQVTSTARSIAQALLLEPQADADPRLGGEPDQTVRLLDTMVLGQRGAASREINEAFLRAGGMHFLAVSGFHVGVLAAATWWLTRRLLQCGNSVAAVAMLAVVVAYALVAEPNAPILRATTMGVLAALTILLGRPLNAINWLACAAIFILACNPLELFRPGFQFSLVLVFMLIGVVPGVYYAVVPLGQRFVAYPLYRYVLYPGSSLLGLNALLAKLPAPYGTKLTPPTPEEFVGEANNILEFLVKLAWNCTTGLFLTCVVMWGIALPLVMLHFGRFAPWGWLGTFLLFVPVTLTLWLSFFTVIANLLFPPVGQMLGAALPWMTSSLFWLVGLFESVPGAVLEVSPPLPLVVTASYATMLVFFVRRRVWASTRRRELLPARRASREFRERTEWVLILVLNVMFFLTCVAWPLLPRGGGGDYRFHIMSVGNGSATVIVAPYGRAVLFDTGTTRNIDAGETVARGLHALGVRRLERVFISHANFDHYSGMPTLLATVPTQCLSFSPYFKAAAEDDGSVSRMFELLRAAASGDHSVATVKADDRLMIGEMFVEVLWPPPELAREVWGANDRSLVFRLHAGGRTVLLPGDIERDAIRGLLQAERAGHVRLAADVLVAPHHGSVVHRDTAAFLTAVNPEAVVVSSATPRPKFAALVCETLGPRCRLLITRDVGAVTIRITPAGEIVLQTPFAPAGER